MKSKNILIISIVGATAFLVAFYFYEKNQTASKQAAQQQGVGQSVSPGDGSSSVVWWNPMTWT